MNLLVTGGCGFIGSNFILAELAGSTDSPASVVNLDKLTYAGNPENLAPIAADPRYALARGDIGDRALVARLLREHRITRVVHFAAESHVDRSIDSPEPFIETNVVGTLRLLDEVRKYWRDLPAAERDAFRFLHVSTDEVYGSLGPRDPAFTESTPYAPNSPYAASKAASDHIARAYHHTYGLPVITTNCSNNYGPLQFPEKLIPLMILNAIEGKPLPIYGDGQNVRDWLYVADHCRGIRLALERGRPGACYNFGGRCERTNLELIDALCAILDQKHPAGKPHAALKRFVPDRPGHDRRYAIDCTRAERELGWSASETLESGLEKTVDWYLTHRDWCDVITQGRYDRKRLGLTGAVEPRMDTNEHQSADNS
ncbi:MAG: dTDP-glucose 4,6-dehydratase [Verrucomicrobiae bacterium]|nr:dTDP-glucose 4,6-dehydratase [Verrucomicrobiae bacterium]